MERRGLNIRKGFLKAFLPVFRTLPLPVASRFVSGIGRLEYRLSSRLRHSFDAAVEHGQSVLDCQWDLSSVSRELAGNHVLWRTRDLLLDGIPDQRAREMFTVAGKEHLDAAVNLGRGCIVLANHFGAHLLPAHWLFREQYPVRFYMERPRHISRYMSRHFQTDGPLGQDKLFISRQGVPADSASSILRAARAIKAGLLLYLGRRCFQMDRTADRDRSIPGPQLAILDDLGRAGGAHRGAGRDGVLPDGARRPIPHRVSPGLPCAQRGARAGPDLGVGPAVHGDTRRPGPPASEQNSNDYFFWSDSDALVA